jgi:DNA-binding NarL/FixJ family response regulator
MSGTRVKAQGAGEKEPPHSKLGMSGERAKPHMTIAPAADADAETPLRVLVVDDHQMVREGLCCLLKEYEDMAVVGEASSGEHALQLASALIPEVVLMDMHMPGWDGAETTKRILKAHPSTVVIGLSIQTDPYIAESMLNAGAAAFLQKEAIGRELYSTILAAVHRGTASRRP